jgi:hypothetical protein
MKQLNMIEFIQPAPRVLRGRLNASMVNTKPSSYTWKRMPEVQYRIQLVLNHRSSVDQFPMLASLRCGESGYKNHHNFKMRNSDAKRS